MLYYSGNSLLFSFFGGRVFVCACAFSPFPPHTKHKDYGRLRSAEIRFIHFPLEYLKPKKKEKCQSGEEKKTRVRAHAYTPESRRMSRWVL